MGIKHKICLYLDSANHTAAQKGVWQDVFNNLAVSSVNHSLKINVEKKVLMALVSEKKPPSRNAPTTAADTQTAFCLLLHPETKQRVWSLQLALLLVFVLLAAHGWWRRWWSRCVWGFWLQICENHSWKRSHFRPDGICTQALTAFKMMQATFFGANRAEGPREHAATTLPWVNMFQCAPSSPTDLWFALPVLLELHHIQEKKNNTKHHAFIFIAALMEISVCSEEVWDVTALLTWKRDDYHFCFPADVKNRSLKSEISPNSAGTCVFISPTHLHNAGAGISTSSHQVLISTTDAFRL